MKAPIAADEAYSLIAIKRSARVICNRVHERGLRCPWESVSQQRKRCCCAGREDALILRRWRVDEGQNLTTGCSDVLAFTALTAHLRMSGVHSCAQILLKRGKKLTCSDNPARTVHLVRLFLHATAICT